MPLRDADVRRLSDAMRLQLGARPDAVAAAIAARQGGAASVAQLAVAGLGARAVSRRVASGRMHPMFRGVVAVGHPGVTRHGWHHAALLAAGEAAALSHVTAGELWGLLDPGPGPIHVTVPGARGRRRERLRVHSGRLDASDVVVRDGLRATTVARTLIDLGELLTVDELVAVLDRAEARRLHHPRGVARAMAAATGRRGVAPLRRALLFARPQDVLTRSELERRALRMVARHRLPRPEVNARVLRYEVDLVWRHHALAVELDGRAWHGDGVALDRDHRRDADLQASGWRVLRFTWRQVVGEPAWVADRIARLLAISGPSG